MLATPCLAWPFRPPGPNGLAFVEQGSNAEVAQCVAMVFTARPGDFIDGPELGLPDQTFREGGVSKSELSTAAHRWEPRAALSIGVGELRDLAQTVGVEVASNG